MGLARRKVATDAGSGAIYDDLRLIRSRGGFRRAVHADFAGTHAVVRRHIAQTLTVDDAARSLRAFTEDYLRDITHWGYDDADVREGTDGPLLAARSLTALLVGPPRGSGGYIHVRNDIAGSAHRDHDYLRREEDRLLAELARWYERRVAEGRLLVGGRAAQRSRVGDAVQRARDSLHHLKATFMLAEGSGAVLPREPPAEFAAVCGLLEARLKELVRMDAEAREVQPGFDVLLDACSLGLALMFKRVGEPEKEATLEPHLGLLLGLRLQLRRHPEQFTLDVRALWVDVRLLMRGLSFASESTVLWLDECLRSLALQLELPVEERPKWPPFPDDTISG